MDKIIFGSFLCAALIHLIYYTAYLKFALFKKSHAPSLNPVPVSIIICAKNEAENLSNFLPSIIEQDYPDFEILLINDASRDSTWEVMLSFQKTDSRITLVNVENNESFWANKKYALTLGIKKAKNPYFIFTDADCVPQSKNWIRKIAAEFSEEKEIVLGYGGYFKSSQSFLNKLIRFETLLTAIQYFSYALWNSPYMGVGRNLAYTKNLFFQQNGFATHLKYRSGDDDLFVNKAATTTNTALCFSEDSITRSIPKNTFNQWFKQKRRHISVAKLYTFKHRLLLSIFYISQLFFWIFFSISCLGRYWHIAVGVLIVKIFLTGIVYYKSAKKLGELDVLWFFPILEIVLVFSQLATGLSNLITKPKHWK